jgi:GntR family transcriptional regulator, transcriptional repressor for pyruvate dehydrogenase complex
MNNIHLTPIRQKTVVVQVMEQIKNLISAGRESDELRLPSEVELAEKFKVSRSTVREAMKIFQYLGVIESRGARGTFVRDCSYVSSEALIWSMLLSEPCLNNLMELKLTLEEQGLWYLLDYEKENVILRQQTLALLYAEVGALKRAITENSIENRLNADYNFHGHLIAVCRNPIFDSIYSTLRSVLIENMFNTQSTLQRLLAVPADHEKIIQTIQEGDYLKARSAIRKHVRDAGILVNGSAPNAVRDQRKGR